MRYICLIIGSFICCSHLFAQEGEVTGKVRDKDTSAPLEFANVVILDRADSTVVKGTVANAEGEFSLALPYGNYLLRVGFIGYNQLFNHINVTEATLDIILIYQVLFQWNFLGIISQPLFKSLQFRIQASG